MDYEFKSLSIEDLRRLALEYFYIHRCNGGSSEFDSSINEISRAMVIKFHEKYGTCFLGEINNYDCDRKNPAIKLVEYQGQTILNFEYDFIIPCDDPLITQMINEHNKEKKDFNSKEIMALIEKINNRVVELGGEFLSWS